jgi:hypothetical protein
MPAYEKIYDRKKEASAQVSTLTRNLALGFIGVSWALLTAHDEPLHSMAGNVGQYRLLSLAAISVVIIACDLLQYVAITSMAENSVGRS